MVSTRKYLREIDIMMILIAQKLIDDCLDYHDLTNDEIIICMDNLEVWHCKLVDCNLDTAERIERII